MSFWELETLKVSLMSVYSPINIMKPSVKRWNKKWNRRSSFGNTRWKKRFFSDPGNAFLLFSALPCTPILTHHAGFNSVVPNDLLTNGWKKSRSLMMPWRCFILLLFFYFAPLAGHLFCLFCQQIDFFLLPQHHKVKRNRNLFISCLSWTILQPKTLHLWKQSRSFLVFQLELHWSEGLGLDTNPGLLIFLVWFSRS